LIKEPERVVVEELNEDFNYFYRGSKQKNSVSEEFIPVSGVFKMRIKWLDPTKEEGSNFVSEIRGSINDNLCRLKMEFDAYDFVSGTQTFVVDGKTCDLVGTLRPHGIINNQFYTCFVKEVR
jgi:hypothetical protein